MKKYLALIPVSLLLMGFACQSSDLMKTASAARDSLAASKGVLATAHSQYDAQCIADSTKDPCPVIHKATAAQNSAADALNLFCNGAAATAGGVAYADGGECHPDATLEPKLRGATTDLNQIIGDVKGVVK